MSRKAWIPISIRIPKENEKVGLKMKCRSLASDIYDIGWRDAERGTGILDNGSSPEADKDLLVVAWQELEPGEYPLRVYDETA